LDSNEFLFKSRRAHYYIASLLEFKTIKRSRENKKLETEIRATDLYQDFLFVTNSPVTREQYSTRLRAFFVHIGIKDSTMQGAGKKVC
jgi:hypothetical protein